MNMPWQKSVTTGRELDPELAVLTGEGAQQQIRREFPDVKGSAVPLWQEVPSQRVGEPDYYRLALLKEPVWIWSVPAYFYVGGVAGGGGLLAALLHGKKRFGNLASWCRMLAFLGTTAGPALLTYDLGKMSRFLNMLRVFRPTSPMSVGSWALSGTGMLSALALVLGNRRAGRPAAYGTAAGGLVVAGYTGVLLGNTANPLWQQRRHTLPLLFTASAMASTAGVLQMLPLKRREERVVKKFGTAGKIAEAACMLAMERETAGSREAAKGLREGKGGALWQAAKGMLVAGLILDLIPARSRWKRTVGGALTTVGSICLRFALLESGRQAAQEPQALLESQRRQ